MTKEKFLANVRARVGERLAPMGKSKVDAFLDGADAVDVMSSAFKSAEKRFLLGGVAMNEDAFWKSRVESAAECLTLLY